MDVTKFCFIHVKVVGDASSQPVSVLISFCDCIDPTDVLS